MTMTRLSAGLLLAAAMATSSGCARPGTSGDDSSPPSERAETLPYVWSHTVGLCGATHAADEDGALWSESGCENGEIRLTPTGEVRAIETVRAAWDRLAGVSAGADAAPCNGGVHNFVVRQEDGRRQWTLCGSSTSVGDPTGLPEPFLSAAEAVR